MKNAIAAPQPAADSGVCPAVNRLPRATYRLQLRSGFGFEDVRQLIPYLQSLGISDLYLSPLFRFREESTHGYDVVDHSRIEPTFGDRDAFRRLAEETRDAGLGIVLDLVPNHMGINDPGNRLWNDVLENGPNARSACYFDIDWNPPGGEKNRVLLPFLGKPFGETLEAGELQLAYEGQRLVLAYYDRRFPIAPTSWPPFLKAVQQHLPESVPDEVHTELVSIITQLRRLPPADRHEPEATEERYREQEVARRRLTALVQQSVDVRAAIEMALAEFNGQPGEPRSWDRLEELLQHQHYRLAYWRVAVDEINYRRFFDINDLAAVRVEIDEVFQAVHQLTFQLLGEGLVTGLRIDHPDGLLDPVTYFQQLQTGFRRCLAESAAEQPPLYIVAEKILSGDEQLPTDWPISGTTGYDFLNRVAAILVDADGVQRLQELYPSLTGVNDRPRDIAYQGKLAILHDSMSSELYMVASQLFRLARANRSSRDFTLPMLLRALREVIACFLVYRTYIRPQGWDVNDEDRRRIMEAVRWAKRRNRTMAWSVLDYVASVMLLEFPPHLSDELQAGWRRLAVRLQQVTGPVTAKGIEDTAFYRYFPLASLNEVGAELGAKGTSLEQFHLEMFHRGRDWPHAMSATATHDMKRGEDVRARLHVISEIPEVWAAFVQHCNRASQGLLSEIDGELAPTENERYLIYQTLLGTWPLDDPSEEVWNDYGQRMATYFEKALREAKQHTSWLNPSEPYEQAVQSFVAKLLEDRQSPVTTAIAALARHIAGPGFVNSLSQLVLKATLPGVPDFYQGCEFWDFRLVDPDNRRSVDYDARVAALQELQHDFERDPQSLLQRLADRWDDSLKLLFTWRLLQTRQQWPELFAGGEYHALEVQGSRAEHVIAFARREDQQWLVVVTPRLPAGLVSGAQLFSDHDQPTVVSPHAFSGELWGDTTVHLPEGAPQQWCDQLALTNRPALGRQLRVAELFSHTCAAVLIGFTHEG